MKNVISILGLLLLAFGANAGNFTMVEVNPAHGNCQSLFSDSAKYVYGAGDLSHFARMNGLLYFVGTDQPNNDELWVTDGTQTGTHKIKEINPNGGAHIGDLRVINNKLVFLANETTTDSLPTSDFDLFTSDGTAAGTYKINDLNQPGNTLLADQSAGILNGQLIFCTNTNVLRTDGTTNGTVDLAAVNIVNYAGANGYCELNGSVYFIVNSSIWKSNGTVSGTLPVRTTTDSINPWPLVSANVMKAFDGKLYIIGAELNHGDELYSFDGTETGALTKVTNASISFGSSYPTSLTICGNSLWYTAYDTSNTYGIFKMSASASSPVRMADATSNLSFGNAKVYYANANNNGYNVIDAITNARSSFEVFGTRLSNALNSSGGSILAIGNKIAYQGYDSTTNNQELFISDGTSVGTRVVMPANVTQTHPFNYQAGCGVSDIFDLTYYNNQIVIPANFNDAGRELWFYEEAGMVNGITDVTALSAVSTYPNPAKEAVTIDLGKETAINAELSIQILDIDGRVVATHSADAEKVVIHTSDLANGSYIVSVNKAGEMISRSKLVVAH